MRFTISHDPAAKVKLTGHGFLETVRDEGSGLEARLGWDQVRVGCNLSRESEACPPVPLRWDALPENLSLYNRLTFTATIAEGSAFVVSTGRSVGADFFGCSWNLVGQGRATYALDLTKPDWCGPTTCFDLQATAVSFLTPWTPTPSTVELRIESLVFDVDPAKALPQGGRIGTAACP